LLAVLSQILNARTALEAAPGSVTKLWRMRACKGARIAVGPDSIVEARIALERPGAVVEIGARSFVNGLLVSATRISIGNDVLMSWGVTVVDHDSHALAFDQRRRDVLDWRQGRKDWTHVATAPVIISDKAWIGFGATILKGVTIGEGAIVGAQSVVTRDVEPWTVVAGNPARVVRRLLVAPSPAAVPAPCLHDGEQHDSGKGE
jgi:acetyltransferase-like isoleucine patch superfamily enzyme